MKRAVDVEIMGQKFTVSSDADENYIRNVALYVDEKTQEVMRAARPLANFNVAMLAALNIADEYHRLKEHYETTLNRLSRLSESVSITLNEEGQG
jgi:cell division protein ZapA